MQHKSSISQPGVTYKVRDPYRTVRFGTHVIHRTSDLKGTVAHKYLPRDPQIWTIPVEFSPNPNQTHPSMIIRVSKIIRKSQIGEFNQGWS